MFLEKFHPFFASFRALIARNVPLALQNVPKRHIHAISIGRATVKKHVFRGCGAPKCVVFSIRARS